MYICFGVGAVYGYFAGDGEVQEQRKGDDALVKQSVDDREQQYWEAGSRLGAILGNCLGCAATVN